jgi:hypothetical protein
MVSGGWGMQGLGVFTKGGGAGIRVGNTNGAQSNNYVSYFTC